jgi:hypothetical protein
MAVLTSDTITTSASYTRGVNVTYSQVSLVYGYNVPTNSSNGQQKVSYAAGGGENGINKSVNITFNPFPASGAVSINLNTGALSGSFTGNLVLPDGSACTFAGINILDVNLAAPGNDSAGSASFTIAGGPTNGWMGPTGNSTVPLDIIGSDSNGQGGGLSFDRSDSIGYPVSASHCELVLTNLDSVNAGNITLNLSGQ